MPRFQLGFLQFANMSVPGDRGRKMVDIFGTPLKDEVHNPANGNTEQPTANGLLVWRKVDNWTAFTDGYQTWINGPYGVQGRLNTDRFGWEEPPLYRPLVYEDPNPNAQYMPWKPVGFLYHATHSTRRQTRFAEFHGTRAWARAGTPGADPLAWHLTVGDDMVSQHMQMDQWGWHARYYSQEWVGIEFAKANVYDEISEEQIRAAVWWVKNIACAHWDYLEPSEFLFHSEIRPGIVDGKVDPYPNNSPELKELRRRILRSV